MEYKFNAKQTKEDLIKWIKDYFDTTAQPGTKAVIGISGGKDSTVVAALCKEALGADRVFGVMLPMGDQENLGISHEVISYLGIDSVVLNIEPEVNQMVTELQLKGIMASKMATVNLLPRVRMTKLYLVSQSIGGRVSNNSNLSETVMGFSTKWGDGVGDFSPLENLTVQEVVKVGLELGIPEKFVLRTPQDDLNYKYVNGVKVIQTDEDVLGINYNELHAIIRGELNDVTPEAYELMKTRAKQNMFKRKPIAAFDPNLPITPSMQVK